jgi:hypothetical protein
MAPEGRRITGLKVPYVKGTLHEDDVSTCMFLRIPSLLQIKSNVSIIPLFSILQASVQIFIIPILPNITLVRENMIPAIQNTIKVTAQGGVNPNDCVVFSTKTIPDTGCIWDPNSLYRRSTASKIRKASEDDLDCTSIRKKSGEIIKKHTGMRKIIKRMVSQSTYLKLDESFLKHR